MKRIKKATKITLLLLLISAFLFYSCLTDDTVSEDQFDISNINSINFDIANYDFLRNEKGFKKSEDYVYYSKKSRVFIDVSKAITTENGNDLTSILISFAQVEEENLNNIVSSFPSTVDIVAITLAKTGGSTTNGIIIHYVDSNDNMKIEIFKKDEVSSLYNLVDFPAKKVDNYTLDDILFIAKTLFPNHDIEALGIDEMQTITSNSKYNDFELLNFAYRYGYYDDPHLDPGGANGSNKRCGLTHHCQIGNDRMNNCQPFAQGCTAPPRCPWDSSMEAMETNNLTLEYSLVNTNLLDENLYSIRDWLETKQKGKFYVEGYYAVSSHFKESIDLELLYKISSSSLKIGTFVQAFLNNEAEVILTEDIYDSIIEIALTSANKSESDLYKNVITELISTTEQYKDKSIGEIKNMLN